MKRKSSIATHTRILEAAERLLKERGVEAIGMEEIAREAGISRRTIYLHFATRTELLLALVDWIDEREGLPALISYVQTAPDATEAINRAVLLQAKFSPYIDSIAAVLEEARWHDPAAETAWNDRLLHRHFHCTELIKWLQREGRLAEGWTVTEAADLLWSITSHTMWRDLVMFRGWSAETYTARLQALLQTMLVQDAAPTT